MHNKKYIAFFILFCVIQFQSYSQQWQWGIRGGSVHDIAGTASDERIYDMASDKNGNTYAVSVINASTTAVLGKTPIATYSQPTIHSANLLLASYSCSGAVRWKKVIGGDESCSIISLRTDTLAMCI